MEKLVCFLALLSLLQYGLCYAQQVDEADINFDIDKRAAKVACVANGTKCNASSQVCCNDPTFVCGRGKRTGDEFLCLGRGDLSCVGPNSKCNATVQCCDPSTYKCQEKSGACKQCAKDGKLCENGEPCCTASSVCTKLSNGTFMCLQPGVTPKMYTTTTASPPCSGDDQPCDTTRRCCNTNTPCIGTYLFYEQDVPALYMCNTQKDIWADDYGDCGNYRLCKTPTSKCTRLSLYDLECIPLGGTIEPTVAVTAAPTAAPQTDSPDCTKSSIPCATSSQCCGYGNGAGDHACVSAPVLGSACLYCAKDGQKCRTADIISLPQEIAKVTGDPLVCCNSTSVCGRDTGGDGPKCLPTAQIKCIDTGFMCGGSTTTNCCQSGASCKSLGFVPASMCQL